MITLMSRAGGSDVDSQLAPLAPIADRRRRWDCSASAAMRAPIALLAHYTIAIIL